MVYTHTKQEVVTNTVTITPKDVYLDRDKSDDARIKERIHDLLRDKNMKIVAFRPVLDHESGITDRGFSILKGTFWNLNKEGSPRFVVVPNTPVSDGLEETWE